MRAGTPRAAERDPAEEAEGEETRRVSGFVWRLVASSLVVLALAAYSAAADGLPDLTLWWDVALAAFVLIPATMLLAWLALPMLTRDGAAAAGIAFVTLALAAAAADLDILGNYAKALGVILLALAFLSFFERAWWVALVALAIPLVDALSVWRGPTRHIVTERPGVFDLLSISFPVPDGSFQLGLPDVLFFSLFLGAAARWNMRVALSWLLMTASFGATMALALWLDPFDLGGLPALPLLSLAFLLANGDHLVRSLRRAPAEPVRYLHALPDPEPEPAPAVAMGIAADDDGWIVARLENGAVVATERRPDLAAALEVARDANAVYVDDPAAEARMEGMADRLYLGPAARRVYLEFLRELLTARDDDEAAAMCRILGWDGIHRESLAWRRRVLAVRAAADGDRVTRVEAEGRTAAERAGRASESPRAR